MRCRYCGIRFLTHPCNARRADLHCPFGCRKEHRRQCAKQRSAKHYQTPKGRKNKKARNGQRSGRAPSPPKGSQFVGLADVASADDSATSNSSDGQSDQPTSAPSAGAGQPVDHADASPTSNARSDQSDRPTSAPPAGVGQPVDHADASAILGAASDQSDQPRCATSAPTSTSVDHCETAPPCGGWLLLEGVRLSASSVVNSPLLSYLQLVASCIERRKIGRDELVQALLTTMRQRSLSAGTRTAYVLDYLNQHPP